jgi:hypothetical protein
MKYEDVWLNVKTTTTPGWLAFKGGFMEVVRAIYPNEEGFNFCGIVGRVMGAIVIVTIWRAIAEGVIWLVT